MFPLALGFAVGGSKVVFLGLRGTSRAGFAVSSARRLLGFLKFVAKGLKIQSYGVNRYRAGTFGFKVHVEGKVDGLQWRRISQLGAEGLQLNVMGVGALS